MVVVTVIALASAIAVLAMPANRGAHEEAARFAVRVRAAHDLAIASGRPVSVWVTGAGYGFDQRAAGGWLPLADKPLRVERWDARTRASTGEAGRLRVVFDATGLADRAAELSLRRDADSALVALGADGSVVVR